MIVPLIRSLRPKQWVKNLFVFAGLIFAQKAFSVEDGVLLTHWTPILRSSAVFAIFCLVSSATYLLNDLRDRAADRNHPIKRNRPIASGAVSVPVASITCVIFYLAGMTGSALLSWQLLLVVAGYALLNLAYSLGLKRVVILDVLIVSFGYVLRALAGTVVISVSLSVWLFICTILLALFVALTKRRTELTTFDANATQQRAVLASYSPQFLDQMISVVTASTVVSYAIYTAAPSEFHTGNLVLTVPFVIYGVFRYLYLVYQKNVRTDPDETLFRDAPLMINIALWLIAAGVIIYFF